MNDSTVLPITDGQMPQENQSPPSAAVNEQLSKNVHVEHYSLRGITIQRPLWYCETVCIMASTIIEVPFFILDPYIQLSFPLQM